MGTSPGFILATHAKDRGLFVTGEELGKLSEAVRAMISQPTVAGPPLDFATLERLARILEAANRSAESTEVIQFSPEEQALFELIHSQAAIRAKLPLRVRRTCTACGDQQIFNPARQETHNQSDDSKVMDDLISSSELFAGGHPYLAALDFLLSASEWKETATEEQVCPVCEGTDFDSSVVTFCPQCHQLRDESVIVKCPNCGFDFLTYAKSSEDTWKVLDRALEQLSYSNKAASLQQHASQFENGLYSDQLDLLTSSLTSEDTLLCMCRCGQPGEVGRHVALLLTSERTCSAWVVRACLDRQDVVGVTGLRGVRDRAAASVL